MSVRLSDVAARAKVSPGLVSKVLNNRKDVRVPSETRQRIVSIADELGYRPSAAARSLRSGKSRNVALVYRAPEVRPWSHAYGFIAGDLAHFLNTYDHHLLIQSLPTQDETLAHLESLARGRTCDLVVLWGEEQDVAQQGRLLETLQLPFVVKGRFEQSFPHWPQIDFDHEAMMDQAVRYLVERGHQRIAYIGYDAEQSFRYCLRIGFFTAMRKRVGGDGPILFAEFGTARMNADTLVENWLTLPEEQRPTAIVVGADTSAWEAIEIGLARRGQRIGEDRSAGDIAVVGTASHLIRLLFGQGMYMATDLYGLSEVLCRELVAPMVQGATLDRTVHRYLPPLEATPNRLLQNERIAPVFFGKPA